jgi:hypothetical protein
MAQAEAYRTFYEEFSAAMLRRGQRPVQVYEVTTQRGLFGTRRGFVLVTEGWLVTQDTNTRGTAWYAMTPQGRRLLRPVPVNLKENRWVADSSDASFGLTSTDREQCARRLAEFS